MVSVVTALGLFAMVAFINGQVPPPPPPPPKSVPVEKQYKCLLNRDCTPYDIVKNETDARVGTLGECKKRCDDLTDAKIDSCKGFVWNESYKTCWLKHTVCDDKQLHTRDVFSHVTALYCIAPSPSLPASPPLPPPTSTPAGKDDDETDDEIDGGDETDSGTEEIKNCIDKCVEKQQLGCVAMCTL